MLKNVCKVAISKDFLFFLLVVCLMFTSFGVFSETSHAVDLNETTDEVELECSIEDKLENSQETKMLKEVDSQNNELMDESDSRNGEILSAGNELADESDSPEGEVLSAGNELVNDTDLQDRGILRISDDVNEIVSETEYTVSGNTFKDIQNTVNSARNGDIIKLNGTYHAESSSDRIIIDKKLIITSASGATLDGKGISACFNLKTNAKGTLIKNVNFINGYSHQASAIKINATNITIDNCLFDNHFSRRGGAVYTQHDLYCCRDLTIKNCNFTNNVANGAMYGNDSSAGALAAFGINSKIINCIFDSNWVYGTGDSYGGAIQTGMDQPGSTAYVTDCIFKNNGVICEGISHGGAGCVRKGTEYKNCVFINNSADMGGALTFHSSGKVEDCTFINNTANKRYGGAISTGYMSGSMELEVINCNFEGNSAPNGGAIQVSGSNVEIVNSNFTKNHVTQYGGAIDIEAEHVSVENSHFDSNIAEVDGGALYIKGTDTTVKDSSFISNHAIPDVKKLNDGLGGAVYINSNLALLENNFFKYNTARNGSAIYYDKMGERLTLKNNTLYQNQAWVYGLPISAEDINYTDDEKISVVLYGGNNIARFNNLAVSNAIYNAADNSKIVIDGQSPVNGARNTGELYQDDREYNMEILLTVQHEDGTVVYNNSLNTSYLGEINVNLENLKEGKYYVTAKHIEDTYYKEITNATSFRVIPKVNNKIAKSVEFSTYDFEDIAVWTLNITNFGPSNSTGVIVSEVLPKGLTLINDTANGKYDPQTGILNVGDLNVGENVIFKFFTVIERTGEIVNRVNITSNEPDSDLSNNNDEKRIFVNPASDLAVAKSVSNSMPNYGDYIDWIIEVSNRGPDAAHNVNVTEMLPKSLIYVENDRNYNPQTGIWKIGTLESRASIKLTIRCIVNTTGLIENNVSVKGSEFDYDLSNNDDALKIFVNSACDLTIEKSANVSEVNYGQLVKWTLVVSNKGPDGASGVNVRDVLPDGFEYVDSTLTKGSYSNGIFDIGTLKAGEIVTINVISKAIKTGEFKNGANVTGNEFDNNKSNNYGEKSILVNPACDLAVEKSVSDSQPNYGDYVDWTIAVSNNGPDVAHDVEVTDLLPEALVWISDDGLGDYDYETGIWNIDQLKVGQTLTLTIRCLVNGSGLIENNVSVKANEYDHDLTNNQANESIDVDETADVSVVKLVDNPKPNYGDLIKWTVVISNKGPDKATDVYVDEVLPKGLILINYTASKGIYDEGIWAMCCLNKGDVETLEIVCKVNATGKISNSVTVHAKETDLNLTNNVANQSIDVPLVVDLEVVKKTNNTNPYFGETFKWTISVKNKGPDIATSVVLNENLPKDVELLNSESSKGTYSNGKWNIGSINVGNSEYLTLICVPKAIGKITNAVDVTSLESDLDKSNNYVESIINVNPVSDLKITKLVNSSVLNYGDLVKYTLIAANNGPNAATNVSVSDVLPKGLILLNSTGNYHNGIWKIGNLGVGEVKELEIICKVTATGDLTNHADIRGNEFDSNLDDNHDEKSAVVNPACDLQITKTASKYYYYVGDVIQYVIEVVNNGPDTAYNVKVDEILDDSLNLKSFDLTGGKFSKSSKVWSIDSLGAGKSQKLSIKAIATTSGLIKNSVSVSNDIFDYDMANNDDSVLVNVSKKAKKTDSQTSKNTTGNKKLDELLKDKSFKDLIDSGSLDKLLKDKNFLNLIKSGSLGKLLKNKYFYDLVKGGYLDKLLKNGLLYKLIKSGYLNYLLKNGYLNQFINGNNQDNYYSNPEYSNYHGNNPHNHYSNQKYSDYYENNDYSDMDDLNQHYGNNMVKHASGNPFAMLLISLMFSIIFVGRNYFK